MAAYGKWPHNESADYNRYVTFNTKQMILNTEWLGKASSVLHVVSQRMPLKIKYISSHFRFPSKCEASFTFINITVKTQ